MEAEELLPDLSESSVALIPDLDEGNARKLQTKITHEHKEFLNKTLANQIQQCMKRIIHHNQMDLFLVCRAGSTFNNQSI